MKRDSRMFNIEKKYLIYLCVLVITFFILIGLYLITSTKDNKYDPTDPKSVVLAFASALIHNDQAMMDTLYPQDARNPSAAGNLNRAYDLMADMPEESVIICVVAELPDTRNTPIKDNEFYIFDARRASNSDDFFGNKIHVFCGRRGSNTVIINLDSQGSARKGSVGQVVHPNEDVIPEKAKEILMSESVDAATNSTVSAIIRDLRNLRTAAIFFYADNVRNLETIKPEIDLLKPYLEDAKYTKTQGEYLFEEGDGNWLVGVNLSIAAPNERDAVAEKLKEWLGNTIYGDISQSKVYDGEEIVYMSIR